MYELFLRRYLLVAVAVGLFLVGCQKGNKSDPAATTDSAPQPELWATYLGNVANELQVQGFSNAQIAVVSSGVEGFVTGQGINGSTFHDQVANAVLQGALLSLNDPLFLPANKIKACDALIDSVTSTLSATDQLQLSTTANLQSGPNRAFASETDAYITIWEQLGSTAFANLNGLGLTTSTDLTTAITGTSKRLARNLIAHGVVVSQRDEVLRAIADAGGQSLVSVGLARSEVNLGLEALVGGIIQGLGETKKSDADVTDPLTSIVQGLYTGMARSGLNSSEISSLAPSVKAGLMGALGTVGFGADSLVLLSPTLDQAILSGQANVGGQGNFILRIRMLAASSTVPLGTNLSLQAIADYADGSQVNISSDAGWTSSAPGTVTLLPATVASSRTVNGLSLGKARISVSLGGVTGTREFEVEPVKLVQLAIEPATLPLERGAKAQLKAMAIYSDAKQVDVSAQAVWTTANGLVARVDNLSARGMVEGVDPGQVEIKAKFGGVTSSVGMVAVQAASLAEVRLDPSHAVLRLGETRSFKLLGVFADRTVKDLTSQATWSVADGALGTASAGVLSSLGKGKSSLVASLSWGNATFKGIASFEIGAPQLQSIDIYPNSLQSAKGSRPRFSAVARYADGSAVNVTDKVIWSSKDPNVINLNNQGIFGSGFVAGTGITDVLAELEGAKGRAVFEGLPAEVVALSVSVGNPTPAKGSSISLLAEGTLSDGSKVDLTEQVSWDLEDPTQGLFLNNGRILQIGATVPAGPGRVIATLPNGLLATKDLAITSATLTSLQILTGGIGTPVGLERQLKAEGNYSDGQVSDLTSSVQWSPSDLAIFSFDGSAPGRVLGIKPGQAEASASYLGITGKAVIDVVDAVPTRLEMEPASAPAASWFPVNTGVQMKAYLQYSDHRARVDVTGEAVWDITGDTINTFEMDSTLTSNGGYLRTSTVYQQIVVGATARGQHGISYYRVSPDPANCLDIYNAVAREASPQPSLFFNGLFVVDPDGPGGVGRVTVLCKDGWTQVANFNNGWPTNVVGAWNEASYGGIWANYKLDDSVINLLKKNGYIRLQNATQRAVGLYLLVTNTEPWGTYASFPNGYYVQYGFWQATPAGVGTKLWTYKRPAPGWYGIDTYEFATVTNVIPTPSGDVFLGWPIGYFLWSDPGTGQACNALPCEFWVQ